MKTVSIVILIILCAFLPALVRAQVPQMINYQGRVTVAGTNFDGMASFKFALVNNGALQTYWSNGVNTVSLTVTKGLYSVLLGDTGIANMGSAIPVSVFTNSDVRLRVWFNDGVSGLQQLSPDQRIAAVGYSLMAGNVPDGLITSNKIAAGAVGSAQIAAGAVGSSQLAAGAVTASALAPGAVGSSQLASNLTISGTLTAGSLRGNGSGLTAVPGTFTWQNVTGTNQQAQPNTGYIATNAAQVTITLPTAPNVGDIVSVSGVGTGGWKIAQNDGQSIQAGTLGFGYTNWNSLTNWTQTSAPNANCWTTIASSADGSKLVAGSCISPGDGGIYVSSNSGSTWTKTGAPYEIWDSIATSGDGTKIAATGRNGIYTSADSGGTWTLSSALSGLWHIATSADGTKLVAVSLGEGIYDSTNSGATWAQTSAPTASWFGVASSADGVKLAAVISRGGIYTSTNSGVTWVQTGAPSTNWNSVASSADGTKLVAGVGWPRGAIYTSTNSGATWVQTSAPDKLWQTVASSADGTRLVATDGGRIYLSGDSGVTWVQTSAPLRGWYSVASSADGTKLVAGVLNGADGIYTAEATIQATTTPGTAGNLSGGQNSAIELQYIGNDQFSILNSSGSINADGNVIQTGLDTKLNILGGAMTGALTNTAGFFGAGSGLSNVNADRLDGQHGDFYQNASNLNAGTLADARLSTNVVLLNSSPNFVGTVSGAAFQGDGSGLTNLNADLLDGLDSTAFAPATGSSVYVAKAGDTMTGPLYLPTNGLAAGTSQLVLSNGNVGVGTASPTSKLQVAGGDLGLGNATATGNQPLTIWLTNASGATRSAGEIVIIGSSDNSFTVTTTSSSTAALGVVYDASIANGAVGRIAVGGVVFVQSSAATVRGQHVRTSGTSGKAASDGSPPSGSSIGVWLESGAAAGTWRALLR